MQMLLCALLSAILAFGSALPDNTAVSDHSQTAAYNQNSVDVAFEPDLFALCEQNERASAVLLSDAAPLGGSVTLLKGTEFNSKIPDSASSLVFTDVAAPDGAIDLSAAQDGGVLGWLARGVFYVSTQREGVCAQANENSSKMFFYKPKLESLDLTMLRTDGVRNMYAMFAYLPSLTELDLSRFNTSGVTNMNSMFAGHSTYGDTALTELDLSSFDTSRVEDMSFMFNHCVELVSLDISSFNTSRVKTMRGMFQQSSYGEKTALTELDVSHFDTSSVTDMGWMFYGLSKLTYVDVSGFDTSEVKNMHHMFAHSNKLSGLDVSEWNVSNVESLNATFHSTAVKTLDLRGWNTAKCESFAQMFEACAGLTEIKGIEKLNTSNGKDFYEMFKDCTKLQTLDISSFDTSSADDSWIDPQRGTAAEAMKDMFSGMSALKKITLGEKFSFKGSDKCNTPCELPANEVGGRPGRWMDAETGIVYTVNDVPDKKAAVYILTLAPRSYTVVFAGNGATSGYVRIQTHNEGVVYPAPECGYVKEGYVFVGWNTNRDGSGITYAAGEELKNLTTGKTVTLYAQWVSEDASSPEQMPDGNAPDKSAPPSAIVYTLLALGAYIAIAYVVLKIWKKINGK